MKKIIICFLVLVLVGCQNEVSVNHSVKKPANETEEKEIVFVSKDIDAFYDELFIGILENSPQWIDDLGDLSEYGVSFQKDKLNDFSDEHMDYMEDYYETALRELDAYEVDDINAQNVKWFLEVQLGLLNYRKHEFFLSHIIGEHRWTYATLLDRHIIETKQDAEDWLSRLIAVEGAVSQWIERYELYSSEGYVMDPNTISNSIGQLRTYYKSNYELMDIYQRFRSDVEALDLSEKEENDLIEKAHLTLEDSYIPAIKELVDVLNESRRSAGEAKGVWALPDGDAYYEFILRKHTTTDLSPEEIHQLGLTEVARIQNEMEKAFAEIGYSGSLSENMSLLYQEADTFTGQSAMDEYVRVASLIEDNLDQYFYKEDLPKTSPTIAVSPGGNFYVSPSIDGKRPGVYYLDLGGVHYDFTINTLAYHETVPGHHFEREHQLHLDSIPMVRKLGHYTAYIEGWALYAEQLADEEGYNITPAHRIGYLKSELHRAARLVVDTGIHYKRWDRPQAVGYLVDEGLLSQGYAEAEVTRYTSWPGQACSYKIGQLKLLELRNMMMAKKGDAFDIKEFHSIILKEGSMPLTILEDYFINNM